MQIRDRVRELRRVRAAELRPHPTNWRTHPAAQQDALKGILAEIGYADALLARELADGSLQLIDGHLRAATTPDAEVPVLVLDVTEDEARKLLVSLDPLAAMAGADSAKLDELLQSCATDNPALARVWEDLAALAASAVEEAIVEDEIPEPPGEAVTRPGDLWVLGAGDQAHRLLCGDSSKAEDVDRLLEGQPVHLVNTDPPYNVRVEPRSRNAIAAGLSSFSATVRRKKHAGSAGDETVPGSAAEYHPPCDDSQDTTKATEPTPSTAPTAPTRRLRAKDRPLANDFVSDAEFERLLLAWFGNAARALVPGGAFYIWGGYANCGNYPPAMKTCRLYFSQAIIWHKQHPVLTRKDFMGDHEWCFYGWREGAAHRFYGPGNVPDVWSVKKVNPQAMVHLTEKPVELAARAVRYSTRAGERVLDLFGGSGSTLMACAQTGRRALLMELDPLYCDVIVKRWEQFTGKKADRISAAKAGRTSIATPKTPTAVPASRDQEAAAQPRDAHPTSSSARTPSTPRAPRAPRREAGA